MKKETRKVYYIDVGNLSKEEATKILEVAMKKVQKERSE